MKRFIFYVMPLGIAFSQSPAGAQEENNSKLQIASRAVQTAQTQLHQERKNYLNTVKTSGQTSLQAQAAKVRLDAAHEAWKTNLEQRQILRREARRNIIHRHDSPSGKSTPP